jgi:glycine cleavage system H protein
MYPKELRYTKEHEWVKVDGDTATIGITSHAQDQLGDIVFVELPKTGDKAHATQSFGTVESVKAVSDIYAPLSGDIVEINEALIDAPETINEDPHAGGWLIKVKIADKTELDTLMTSDDYEAYVSAESES